MLNFTLLPFDPRACCICGSHDELSGEHKIKASLLRHEFGKEEMLILKGDAGSRAERLRSSKSRRLHFDSFICKNCNCSVSQASDTAFDAFHRLNCRLFRDGTIEKHYNDNPSPIENFISVLRYFAKIMCCHLSDFGSPRFRRLSDFVMINSDDSPIALSIRPDPVYRDLSGSFDKLMHASHGGLAIYADEKTRFPNAFHSSLSFGPIQYIFWARLNDHEKMELIIDYRDFVTKCVKIALMQSLFPPPNETLEKAGLV